jgi:hypothetical protein
VKLPATRRGFPEFKILLIRYMPLDPTYKVGLARHETGQNNSSIRRRNYEQKHG